MDIAYFNGPNRSLGNLSLAYCKKGVVIYDSPPLRESGWNSPKLAAC